MTNHGLIHPARAGRQTGILPAIPADGLDGSSASLAENQGGEVGPKVVAHEVLAVAVTVSGHDQAQEAVLGSVDPQGHSPQTKILPPLQAELVSQLGHGPSVATIDHGRPRMQGAHPGQPQAAQHLGEPARGVVGIEGDVLAATRQETCDACLRLAHVQEDQAGHVEDQDRHRGATYVGDSELLQGAHHFRVQATCGTIQSRRHEGNPRREKVGVSPTFYPTVASLPYSVVKPGGSPPTA